MISFVDRVGVRSGLAQCIRTRYSGYGAALTFHQLHPCPQQLLYHQNYFSERGLIAILHYCLRSGIDIVNIDEAIRRLGSDRQRYFVVLTFDDGYRDNYTRVLPILNALGLPFTVFVCTSIIDRTCYYWWGGLVDLFRAKDDVDVEAMGIRFKIHNQRDRETALFTVTKWVEGHVGLRSAELMPTFRRYGISPTDLLDQDAMKEEELRTLSENPLVTIGGHGRSHQPMATMSEEEAKSDIVANREHLQRITGQQVIHFAYPFGDHLACTQRDAQLVRSVGYKSAFSTRSGNLFPPHSRVPFMLPRYAMHPRREGVFNVQARFAGLHRFLKSRGGSPIQSDTLPDVPVLAL